MSDSPSNVVPTSDRTLPRNIEVFGPASLPNDTAGAMIFPLLPSFLPTNLGSSGFPPRAG